MKIYPRHTRLEMEKKDKIRERLNYLRGEIEAERISYGEITELQGLADHIDPDDTQLLYWAGVPENQQFNKTHTIEEIKEARQAVINSNKGVKHD